MKNKILNAMTTLARPTCDVIVGPFLEYDTEQPGVNCWGAEQSNDLPPCWEEQPNVETPEPSTTERIYQPILVGRLGAVTHADLERISAQTSTNFRVILLRTGHMEILCAQSSTFFGTKFVRPRLEDRVFWTNFSTPSSHGATTFRVDTDSDTLGCGCCFPDLFELNTEPLILSSQPRIHPWHFGMLRAQGVWSRRADYDQLCIAVDRHYATIHGNMLVGEQTYGAHQGDKTRRVARFLTQKYAKVGYSFEEMDYPSEDGNCVIDALNIYLCKDPPITRALLRTTASRQFPELVCQLDHECTPIALELFRLEICTNVEWQRLLGISDLPFFEVNITIAGSKFKFKGKWNGPGTDKIPNLGPMALVAINPSTTKGKERSSGHVATLIVNNGSECEEMVEMPDAPLLGEPSKREGFLAKMLHSPQPTESVDIEMGIRIEDITTETQLSAEIVVGPQEINNKERDQQMSGLLKLINSVRGRPVDSGNQCTTDFETVDFLKNPNRCNAATDTSCDDNVELDWHSVGPWMTSYPWHRRNKERLLFNDYYNHNWHVNGWTKGKTHYYLPNFPCNCVAGKDNSICSMVQSRAEAACQADVDVVRGFKTRDGCYQWQLVPKKLVLSLAKFSCYPMDCLLTKMVQEHITKHFKEHPNELYEDVEWRTAFLNVGFISIVINDSVKRHRSMCADYCASIGTVSTADFVNSGTHYQFTHEEANLVTHDGALGTAALLVDNVAKKVASVHRHVVDRTLHELARGSAKAYLLVLVQLSLVMLAINYAGVVFDGVAVWFYLAFSGGTSPQLLNCVASFLLLCLFQSTTISLDHVTPVRRFMEKSSNMVRSTMLRMWVLFTFLCPWGGPTRQTVWTYTRYSQTYGSHENGCRCVSCRAKFRPNTFCRRCGAVKRGNGCNVCASANPWWYYFALAIFLPSAFGHWWVPMPVAFTFSVTPQPPLKLMRQQAQLIGSYLKEVRKPTPVRGLLQAGLGTAFVAPVRTRVSKYAYKLAYTNRALADTPQPNHAMVAEFNRWLDKWLPVLIKRRDLCPTDFKLWNSYFPAGRQREHCEAWARWHSGATDSYCWLNKAMLKIEKLLKLTHQGLEEYAPRLIQMFTADANVRLGPFSRTVGGYLKRIWRVGGIITYGPGLNAKRMGRWFDTVDDDWVYVEDDFTLYDSTEGAVMFAAMEKILIHLGASRYPFVLEAFRKQFETKGSGGGWKYSVPFTMKSGSSLTSVQNSCINALTHLFVYWKLGIPIDKEIMQLIVNGDDNVLRIRRKYAHLVNLERVRKIFRCLGLVAKPAVVDKHCVRFCGATPWPTATGFVMGPDLARHLPRMGFSLYEQPDLSGWMYEVAEGYLNVTRHVPIMRSFVDWHLAHNQPAVHRRNLDHLSCHLTSQVGYEMVDETYVKLSKMYGITKLEAYNFDARLKTVTGVGFLNHPVIEKALCA